MNKRINIPNALSNYIERHQEKRTESTDKFERKQVEKRNEEATKERELEKRAMGDIEYAKHIYDWVQEFRESETGSKILNLLPRHCRPDRGLSFFVWNPGWHYSLSTTDKGIEWYRYGPGSETICTQTPEELSYVSNKETPGMLKGAYNAIENGRVWVYIRKEMRLFEKHTWEK